MTDHRLLGLSFARPLGQGKRSEGYEWNFAEGVPPRARQTFEKMCRSFRWRADLAAGREGPRVWSPVFAFAIAEPGLIVVRFSDDGHDDENRPHTLRAAGWYMEGATSEHLDLAAQLLTGDQWPNGDSEERVIRKLEIERDATTAETSVLRSAIDSRQSLIIGDTESCAIAGDFWEAELLPRGVNTRSSPSPHVVTPGSSRRQEISVGELARRPPGWLLPLGFGAGALLGSIVTALVMVFVASGSGNDESWSRERDQLRSEIEAREREKQQLMLTLDREQKSIQQSLDSIRASLRELQQK